MLYFLWNKSFLYFAKFTFLWKVHSHVFLGSKRRSCCRSSLVAKLCTAMEKGTAFRSSHTSLAQCLKMIGKQRATNTRGQSVKAIKALRHNYFLHHSSSTRESLQKRDSRFLVEPHNRPLWEVPEESQKEQHPHLLGWTHVRKARPYSWPENLSPLSSPRDKHLY